MSDELAVIDPISSGPAERTAPLNWFGWSDLAGMIASVGCAIHCAAMPFVIAYLPGLGLSFLADEAFHQWMAVGCFFIALTAFIPGLRKHRRLTPLFIGSVGLVMISVAAFAFAGECCSAGDTNTASVTTASSELPQNVISSIPAENCADDCCPLCVSKSHFENAGPDAASPERSASLHAWQHWARRMAAWLTPLGGILLVCAHLLNRRYGCLCVCRSSESVRGNV